MARFAGIPLLPTFAWTRPHQPVALSDVVSDDVVGVDVESDDDELGWKMCSMYPCHFVALVSSC